jgi:NAD(P)-dependent dehydrogenase (short-subunit alcohol dehydrogenase family)
MADTTPRVIDRFRMAGRRALVTGGSRGIGRAIALALAEAGADVAVTCESRVELAEEVAAEARGKGVRAAAILASLATQDGPARTYDDAVTALGCVDVLILNASVQVPRPWRDVTADEFELQVAVNLRASLELMQRAAPAMCDRGWGRILAVGSVQEATPHPDMIVYAATKSAQESMVRNLAKQLGPRGVTVNNLAPGVIVTDRNIDRLSNDTYRGRVLDRIPVRRFGDPADCAAAALLLCSDAGGYINGANLYVDGGMRL